MNILFHVKCLYWAAMILLTTTVSATAAVILMAYARTEVRRNKFIYDKHRIYELEHHLELNTRRCVIMGNMIRGELWDVLNISHIDLAYSRVFTFR